MRVLKLLIFVAIVSTTVVLLYSSAASSPIIVSSLTEGDPPVFLPVLTRNYCGDVSFIDDFNDASSGWRVGDNSHSRWEYLANEYRILQRTPDSWTRASREPNLQPVNDYRVAVDVRNATGVYGSYGIIFNHDGLFQTFLSFEIDPDGFYAIFGFSNGQWTLRTAGQSSAIRLGNASNHLEVVRTGATIQAYANGQMLASLMDTAVAAQTFLIVSSYDDANVDARFDNFLLCGDVSPAPNAPHNPAMKDSFATHEDADKMPEWQSQTRSRVLLQKPGVSSK